MPFPDSERVVYARNPLSEVICQLRFPAILKIQTTLPAEYQEEVRGRFPVYEERLESRFKVSEGAPTELRDFFQSLNPADRKHHLFKSEDDEWLITLCQDSISLRTTKYPRWEEFFECLQFAITPFVRLYEPAFYSRIGLRYVDVIKPSELGLQGVPWRELLHPYIAGEFMDERVAGHIDLAMRESTINLVDIEGKVTLRHGLGIQDQPADKAYIIDADFYKDTHTTLEQAYELLSAYNRRAGNLFRWCITNRLTEALEPTALAN